MAIVGEIGSQQIPLKVKMPDSQFEKEFELDTARLVILTRENLFTGQPWYCAILLLK